MTEAEELEFLTLKRKRAMVQGAPAAPEKPRPSLAQAALPALGRPSQPVQVPVPMGPGAVLPNSVQMTVNPGQAAAVGGELLSLPVRAAGAVAGELGYTGATGGPRPFRKALADPETGLARPARERLGKMAAEAWQGGEDGRRGLMDYGKAGLAGAGYLAASVAEDPTAILGGVAKVAPRAVGRVARTIGAPQRFAAKEIAPVMRGGAERIQQTVLRPRKGDWDAGFDLKDIEKHGVQGNVDEVIEKSQAKIDATSEQLRALIKAGKDDGARVNLFSAIEKAKAKLMKDGSADLIANMEPALDNFRAWAKIEANREGKNMIGSVDLLRAQEFKQMMGGHGAWEKVASSTRQGITQGERYQSRAAQAVYIALKEEIEKAAPAGIKELNKTLSDLIPIRNAAAYRKIVSDRNNPIGLTDVLSGMAAVGNGPAGAAILAGTRFFKSGFGAKSLYGLASAMERAKTPAEAAFYAQKLQALGLTAAEIDALRAGSAAAPNVIPFRKVAEADATDQRRAAR